MSPLPKKINPSIPTQPSPRKFLIPPENFSTPPENFATPPPKISQPPPQKKFLNPPENFSTPPPKKFLNPPPENFSIPPPPRKFLTPPPQKFLNPPPENFSTYIYILFVIVCLIIYGLFSILLLGITSTQLRIVSFFKLKEIGKKGKHPECGDWNINGGGGGG